MIYLNIGSGQRPFKPPWLNYDVQDKWRGHTEEQGCKWLYNPGLTKPETYDMICFHHVLEHYGCGEADSAITECYGWLKPGGSLLVFVPNNRELARRYMTGAIDEYTFNVNMYGAYMGDEADRHKWSYCYESLKEYLEKWKWSKVDLFDYREIEGADIARDYWILGMEAIK